MLSRRNVLRSDRGVAVVDAMVGVIIVGLTLTGLTTAAVTAGGAVRAVSTLSERSSFLRSYVNELAREPRTVSETPVTQTLNVDGDSLQVTRWSEITETTAVIHAATASRDRGTGAECADPSTLNRSVCLASQTTVTLVEPGVRLSYLSPAWADANTGRSAGATSAAGTVGTFTVPADVTEVRYVVKLTSGTAPGELVFRTGGTVLELALFDETSTGYIYGSVNATAGGTVTVELTDAGATLAQFRIYEAAG